MAEGDSLATAEAEAAALGIDDCRDVLAATGLFGEALSAEPTTDELADEAGVVNWTWHRYMTTKEQALFENHERFLRQTIINTVSVGVIPADRFLDIMSTRVAAVVTHQLEIRAFAEDIRCLGLWSQAEFSRGPGSYEAVLDRNLREAGTTGQFPERDVALMSRGILGSLNEVFGWYPRGTSQTAAEIVDGVVQLYVTDLVRADTARLADLHDASTDSGLLASLRDPDPLGQRNFGAAEVLFRGKGYQGATTWGPAAAAGLTKSPLFYHMGPKVATLERIHRTVVDTGIEARAIVLHMDETRPQQFVEAMIGYWRVIGMLLDVTTVIKEDDKNLLVAVLARPSVRRREYEALFSSIVRTGVCDGRFREVNMPLASRLLLRVLNFAYRWYRFDGKTAPDQIGIQYANVVIFSLQSPSYLSVSGRTHG